MTQNRSVSVVREIESDAATIFAMLADPDNHCLIDGSGTVKSSRKQNPTRLQMGSKFGMDMRMGIPYRISNTVVEFEEDRQIAWSHLGGHIWRYELEPLPNGNTLVTESFDWATARVPKFYELVGYPNRHVISMTKTLERLASIVE